VRKRRKNIYFGFGPAPKDEPRFEIYRRSRVPAKRSGKRSARSISVGEGDRADLVSALVNLGYDKSVAKRAAAAASGSDFDSQLRDALNRLSKKNPRVRTNTMQKKRKKKRKKKRNKMPSGLRKYWLKMRRKKNSRKISRKRNASRRPRARKVSTRLTKAEIKILRAAKRAGMATSPLNRGKALEWWEKHRNPRKRKNSRRRRHNRRNPPRAPRMVRPPFAMTSTQLKKYARALARATGKRVRIKSR
jgi:RuvA, C-terminal domain